MSTREPDGGDVYNVGRTTSANPSVANTALTNQQIEAIFRPRGRSAPIDDYITQVNTLAQNWKINAGNLQQTVSDPATPTSMAGLLTTNTGPMKWTGAAASSFGTRADATISYADTVSQTMPKLQAALGSLSDGLGKSKAAFEPIFDAWGSPGSGSKATVANDLSTVLQMTIPILVIMGYDYKDQEQYNYCSDTYKSIQYNATVYTPAKNMHADPSNPYVAGTFDVYAADHNGSGDYGYSGMVWCSYDPKDQYQVLQKYVVWDSANGNNQISDKDGNAFTAGYIQTHLWQQYNTHLLDLMTITGQHFSTARSQFPALPQPDKALAPPTDTATDPSKLGGGGGGGIPGGLGGGGVPGGLGNTRVPTGTPTGFKTVPPVTGLPPRQTSPTTPPPYQLPTPTPPPSGLPGPGGPGSTGGTGVPGLPGYTSTQTAGFDPTKMPTLSSGSVAGGLGRLPGTGGLAGGLGTAGLPAGLGGGFGGGAAGGLGSVGGVGGVGGLSGPGALDAAGTSLAAGETATAGQAALGGQAAAAEAGAAGRMPMMPPMAPMGMNGASDRNRKSWLPEEEDLWGLAEGSAAPPVIGSDL